MASSKRKLKILKNSRRGTGHLYMVAPVGEEKTVLEPDGLPPAPIGKGIITDLPVENTGYSDPDMEVDYYSLPCDKLRSLIDSKKAYLETVRLTAEGTNYYNRKIAEAETAYTVNCGLVKGPETPILPPDPPPPPSPPPVTITPNPTALPGVTVNVGDTSSLNPQPGLSGGGFGGAGGGGGGGGSSDKKAAAKKSNWWLWAICIGALCLSLYKGRNTVTKIS